MDKPYIIALGASTGGLEEINSFFDFTEKLDVSYVIIHHFSKENISTLVELLSRHSKLSVQNATDQMYILPNVVYILPEGFKVTIKNYQFHMQLATVSGDRVFSIDHFFSSLASCCGRKALGVILSGMGTDGSEGLKAIKHCGGTVIVRNPKTTNYNEMAMLAIDAGVADYITEPELMPELVERIILEEKPVIE